VKLDSSVPERKSASSETFQMASSTMIGLTSMELTSVVSPLHNYVMKDHMPGPSEAAGTSTSYSDPKWVGQRLLNSCN
jgi:hypothetical protein